MKRLELVLKNNPTSLIGYVPDWREQLNNLARRPRRYSWMVSNLAVMKEPSLSPSHDESWTIHSAQFSLSAIMVSSITAVNGQMCVTGS